MSAVWYRARAEFRTRWRSMLVIALLLGLGSGAVLAAAAGARRTDTAYPRLLEHTHAAHLAIAVEAGAEGPSPAEVRSDPAVISVRPVRFYLTLIGAPERCDAGGCLLGVSHGRALGGPIDEMTLIEGRLPDQEDPSEVALTVAGVERLSLRVGDEFLLRGVPFDEPFFTGFAERAEQQRLTMRVVGVVATPGDFPPQVGDETIHARFTHAFHERFPEPSFGLDGSLLVRLTDGGADVASFLERLFTRHPELFPFERTAHARNVQRGFHLQALALWALAGVAGLTLMLVIAQTIAREIYLAAGENEVLGSLGLSRAQRWVLGLLRAGAIGTAGVVLSIPSALALSPLLPRGLPRAAEPSPGFAADWLVLGLGATATFVFIVALALVPAWRVARLEPAGQSSPRRTSATAEAVARAGASPPIVAGARFAFTRGRGRSALPVGSTIAGVTLGVVAVVATISFGSSLDHLLATPRLYGVSFDMVLGAGSVDFRERAGEVLTVPEVEGIAWGFDVGIFAGGRPLSGVMLDTDHPPLWPPLREGRAPGPAERLEAVLGVTSARRLAVGVGDTFSFQVPDTGQRLEAIVVGIGSLPTFDDTAALGDGVWFSLAGVSRAVGQDLPADKAFVDLAPDADAAAAFAKIADVLGTPIDEDLWRPPIGTPNDLVSFGNVRRLPIVLAGLVGTIALGILAHTLHSTIRRRARDLAVLRTLGFTRAQTKRAVVAQASLLAILAAALGIPGGVVAGRWLWRAFADAQGIVAHTVIKPWAMVITGASVLVLAVMMAMMPARAAARRSPAMTLRSE